MGKVLFIAGPGRSGSTLVAELLGQYDAIVNVGEMFWYFNKVDVVPPSRCGCGMPLNECAFWHGVLNQSPAARMSPQDEQRFFAMRSIASWPSLFWRGRRREAMGPSAQVLAEMYRGAAAAASAEVVVDASKLPGIALVASTIDDIDFYVLHLTRDPRSVVNAWRTPKGDALSPSDKLGRRRAWQVIWWWLARSLASEWLVRRRVAPGHFLRISYEEFADAPRDTIERIVDFVGASHDGDPFAAADRATIVASHTVIGNPDRHNTGERTIERRDRWRKELPWATRLATEIVTWPVMRWFGLGSRR